MKKYLYFFLVVLAFVGMAVVLAYVTNVKAEGMCGPLQGDSFISVNRGIYVVDELGVRISILRGIALGTSSSSDIDTKDSLPPCYSSEEGLTTFRNLVITAEDGTKVILVKGVGFYGSVGETEEPTPLP